jgi:3',5'-cyclic AMP phosphodiesterase CpdA
MALIIHLSDLHLLSNPQEQEVIFDELVSALRHVGEQSAGPVRLLAITGDVFDSATIDAKFATHRFAQLHKEICAALGGEVPTVIVPGNHDRRRLGLFGPHRGELFEALQETLQGRAWVHGCNTPFLSELVPPSYHGLPLWVVAYDSTYLPRGLVSAGGALRQEDLLYAAAQIAGKNPDWPVLFMLHHHLVPTPLTDLGPVEIDNAPAVVRWGVQRVLPDLIAHADREELTMTALGAGTALSTLHTLGRSVLAIHGHKHYATARMLDGMSEGDGDLLVVSAGSAGQAQRWNDQNGGTDSARLWPSFNVIELQGDDLAIDTVSFAWKEEGSAKRSRRALVRARRSGSQWRIEPLRQVNIEDAGPRLALNAARCQMRPSTAHQARWDYECEREVRRAPAAHLHRYLETVNGLEDGLCVVNALGAHAKLPLQVHLQVDGSVTYLVLGGVFRTLVEARRILGDRSSPFAHVALMNRYYSELASLSVSGLSDSAHDAFASATDLGTGLERPIPLERGAHAGEIDIHMRNCPPRTLLRLYWRLDRT